MKLANKVAIVTGGTTGIGLASARLFLAEGAKVVVTGRDPGSLAAARAELPGADVVASDQSKVADIEQLAAHVKERYGHLDVLFVNAGIAEFRPLELVDEAFYDRLMSVNLRGAFFTVQKLAPLMREGGSIVFNTSVAGSKGSPAVSVYGATKAGLRSLARHLSAELAPRRIRVNAVSPGPIETPIFGKLGMSPEQISGLRGQMTASVPMQRFGTAEEIARAALFLASSDSSYVLGSEIAVDGGFSQL